MNIHLTEVFLGIFIGAVTFTGSIVAFGKLRGKISSKPLMLPNRHKLNLAALVVSFVLLVVFVRTESVGLQVLALLVMTIIALAFGWHLVASIGGADMPVVVSMLNSYSGWAAAAAGFMLSNDLLIVTGALVGSSGAILSYIMCKAMNRSFISVIAGGFGSDGSSTGSDEEVGEHREISAEDTAEMLKNSHSVIITRLWHGGGAGAVSGGGNHRETPRARYQGSLWYSPGGGASAGPHERAAGGSEGALRHRAGNGRDQR